MKAIVALLLCAGVSSAHAAALPSFEQSLGLFRQEFLGQRAKDRQVKAKAAGAEIDSVASGAERLQRHVQDLRQAVNDLRWRAMRTRPADPWLRNDLQRLVWALRDDARYAQDLAWRAQRILNDAQKDPSAVQAAQRLRSSSSWLRSEAGWLQMDAQNAGWDFRRAGYSFEAFDVENGARDTQNASEDLESLAGQILSKVS